MPQQNDYLVDPVLTNMAIGYQNAELIGEQIFPRLEVPNKTGYYYVFNKDNFRIEDSTRSGMSRAKRIDYGFTKASYGPLTEQSLEEGIEWEMRDSYPTQMDAYSDATENVSAALALGLEKQIADKVLSTAVITNNVTLAGVNQFSDYANSDPFTVIQTGIDTVLEKGLVMPNTCVMGYQAWAKIKNHPDLLGRLSVNTVRTLTPALFAEFFGFEKVLIGKSMHNSAKEGQTATMSYVWGKDMLLCYVPARVGIKQLATGYTLQMKGAKQVDRWSEQAIKTDFVRSTDYYEPKFVSADAAYLIKACVA